MSRTIDFAGASRALYTDPECEDRFRITATEIRERLSHTAHFGKNWSDHHVLAYGATASDMQQMARIGWKFPETAHKPDMRGNYPSHLMVMPKQWDGEGDPVKKLQAAIEAGLKISGMPNRQGKTESDLAALDSVALKQAVETALRRQNSEAAPPAAQPSTIMPPKPAVRHASRQMKLF